MIKSPQGGISVMTVNEVAKLTGVSIRTLQYYDKIGLLKPTGYTRTGYRLYDDTALTALQQILFFKELEFSLKDIKAIMESPSFDKDKALEQQIEMLKIKKERLENLIELACGIKKIGASKMDFSAFDTKKTDEYAKRAKEEWGATKAYEEYEKKASNRTPEQQKALSAGLMGIFAELGELRNGEPSDEKAQSLVEKLQEFITEHYYLCTSEILSSLGDMYACGGEFTQSIDKVGGDGTATFTDRAIKIFCENS